MNELLAPFTYGALEMLTTMLGVMAEPADGIEVEPALASYVNLEGERRGRLVLSFPHDSALALVAEMMAMDLDEVDEEMLEDGVGEIANMIAGYAKTRLADSHFHFNLNLPSVAFSEEERTNLQDGRKLSQVISTEFGPFEVAVFFNE